MQWVACIIGLSRWGKDGVLVTYESDEEWHRALGSRRLFRPCAPLCSTVWYGFMNLISISGAASSTHT